MGEDGGWIQAGASSDEERIGDDVDECGAGVRERRGDRVIEIREVGHPKPLRAAPGDGQ